MPPPLGWLAGWQVCAPYIPSHSPLAARLPPNQKILQDIMRYAPKVDRWLLRSAETSIPFPTRSPSFPLPSFSSCSIRPVRFTNVIFRWKGSPGPRSSFWIARAPELFLDFLHLAERTRIVRFFFFFLSIETILRKYRSEREERGLESRGWEMDAGFIFVILKFVKGKFILVYWNFNYFR